jgi:PIN domain nuclease of toxin-antitoxin system
VIVLDTHAWVWWLTEDPRLSESVRAAAEREAVGVAAISCFEVALLARRGRIGLDRDVRDWIRVGLAVDGVRLLALDAEVATDAALIDGDGFPGDPADRLIYATARRHSAPLATKDRRLRAFDPANTVW